MKHMHIFYYTKPKKASGTTEITISGWLHYNKSYIASVMSCVFGFKLKVYPIKIPSYTSEHSLYLASYLYVSLPINIAENLFQTPEAALEATNHYSDQLGLITFL